MGVFGIGAFVIALGVLGYVWKFRNSIIKIIPGNTDNEVLDVIEGVAEQLDVSMDDLAEKSRGKLKKRIKNKWL